MTTNSLILGGHVIRRDIKGILTRVRSSLINGKLANIQYAGSEVKVTCPFHKDGKEATPSCYIYAGEDSNLVWGTFHCFACGEKGSLVKFISACSGRSKGSVEEWLKKDFTESVVSSDSLLIDDDIPLDFKEKEERKKYLNDSILDRYQKWHPYIEKRHISREVAERFELRYNPETKSIVFPVRDTTGRLVFLTERSVEGKKFHIDTSASKTVYLLSEALRMGYKQVIVAESQINALVSYSYGFPAVALFGAGTTEGQMEELNKTDILHFVLMYDNDEAGRKGASRFKKMIKPSVFVTDIIMPRGKDIADCTREEFLQILKNNGV